MLDGKIFIIPKYITTVILHKALQAKNLPICDDTGYSDPYCVLKMNKQKFSSKIIKQNLVFTFHSLFSFSLFFLSFLLLQIIPAFFNFKKKKNPVWNEAFHFRYEDVSSVITIELWDKDWLSSDDFMGKLLIPVTSIKVKKNFKFLTFKKERTHKKRELIKIVYLLKLCFVGKKNI